jgi:CBS domain-containing protein
MRISGLYRREVVTAELADSVEKAARRMRLHEISALPIVEHERLVGIVTERDITSAVALRLDVRTTTVADVMTQHPLVAGPDEDSESVAMRMLEHGIRHLPVVAGHRVLGIMSARDLLALEAWEPALPPLAL